MSKIMKTYALKGFRKYQYIIVKANCDRESFEEALKNGEVFYTDTCGSYINLRKNKLYYKKRTLFKMLFSKSERQVLDTINYYMENDLLDKVQYSENQFHITIYSSNSKLHKIIKMNSDMDGDRGSVNFPYLLWQLDTNTEGKCPYKFHKRNKNNNIHSSMNVSY